MKSPEKKTTLSVYDYLEAREYLSALLESKKRRNSRFSLRAAAAQLEVGSGTLSRILNGTRHIGEKLLPRFVAFCGLRDEEATYFKTLVALNQSHDAEERQNLYQTLLRLRGDRRTLLQPGELQLFENWYHIAILSLFEIKQDLSDPERIGELLTPTVSGSRCRKALAFLLDMGFIRANSQGGYSPSNQFITTGGVWRDRAVHNYQRMLSQLGTEALDRFPKEERNFSTLTVGLSPESMKKARAVLKRARQEISALEEAEKNPESVSQFIFQVFPLTKADPK